MPSHNIIDNRTEKLADHIARMLDGSQSAKFAVGYFFIGGLEQILPHLKKVEELKILIGNVTTRQTLEQLSEGYKRLELVERAQDEMSHIRRGEERKVLEETAKNMQETFEFMDQTDKAQESIATLARLIEEKRVKVRIYTKGRLHAKTYIFDYADPKRYEKGIAIVGSSNLTLAGVSHNTELNVVVQGNDNHAELTRWFDELWAEAKDFDEALLRELNESWAMKMLRPYDIYIKTLYNLVKDRLEGEEEHEFIWDPRMPELMDFQKVAVRQAVQMLKDQSGVFIGDVVGTGKTFIGIALLQHFYRYHGMSPLIICPACLVNTWEEFKENYDVPAPVLSMGMISQGNVNLDEDRYRSRDLVLIDESHNLRYPDTTRYKSLQPYLQGKKVILVTATPRNNTPWDIYYQIRLFHPEDRTELPIDPPDLRQFFKKVENGERPLQEVLRQLLIRRTRKHILDWYGEEDGNGRRYVLMGNRRFYFPERELKTIEYSIDQVYQGVYGRITELIKKLNYARYGLWNYVIPEKQHVIPYADLNQAGRNLRGLMKTMLLKRFESSVYAFQKTVERLLHLHKTFVNALEKGLVPAGEDTQRLLYESDVEEEMQLYVQLESMCKTYDIAHFDSESMKNDIKQDTDVLQDIYSLVADIGPEDDDKLQVLKKHLDEEPLRSSKLVLFTQFAETAEYLYENLRDRADTVMIDSKTSNKSAVVRRFAPKSNKYQLKSGEQEIQLLFSTDVLSEGLNLQDAMYVMNYDLHWNPVRLIQRIGRVDRLGQEAERIWAYNFLPELELEAHLGLREKLKHRIAEIHETIGEDAPILERSERLNEEVMYAIYEGRGKDLEKFEEEEKLFGLAEAEELMRKLRKENPEYSNLIANLPDGVRSARKSDETKGAFVFCQAGNYQQLFLTDPEGQVKTRDLEQAIAAVKCEANEPAARLPRDFNVKVSKIRNLFAEEVKRREAEKDYSGRLSVGQRYVVRELNALFRATDDEDKKSTINMLDKVFRQGISQAANRELNILRRNGVTGDILLERLREVYITYGLKAFLDSKEKKKEEEAIPKIVCSEALV